MSNDYFSSQSSTQEIQNTQDLCHMSFEDDPNMWGRFLPLKSNLQNYDFIKDDHSFGRATGLNDYAFTESHFDTKILYVLSKIHFKITREIKDNDFVIILEDCSSNGTFVNGVLVGKNNKQILQNNDEISIAQPKLKVFTFYDCNNNDSNQFPLDVTKKYTICRVIGTGSFGEVRLAYKQGSLQRVAIKILKKSNLSLNGTHIRFNTSQIENEIKLLTSINHPCIIKLLDLIESTEKIFIVMELAEGGDLFSYVEQNGPLKEPIVKLFIYQLLMALSYLHEKRITHRDVKPENILLEVDKTHTLIKLTDFGLSKLAEDVSQMTTFCGTQAYIAPELLNPSLNGYTSKVDMWSVGVVLFVCFAASMPFYDKNELTNRLNILNGRYKLTHPCWLSVSELAKDLIRKLLVVDSSKRLSAEEALKHSWFEDEQLLQTYKLLLAKETQLNGQNNSPNKRPLEESSENGGQLPEKTPKLMSGLEFLTDQ